MKTVVEQLSVGQIQAESEDLARNAIALYPDLPAANLVGRCIEMAEAGMLSDLDRLLETKHFLRAIGIVRRQDKPKPASLFQYAPFQKAASIIPRRLKLKSGEIVTQDKYSFEHLDRIIALRTAALRKKSHQKKENDPVILATKEIMAAWPTRTKKLQGLTLAEVDALLFPAGLNQ
jgi:hypothetical protein